MNLISKIVIGLVKLALVIGLAGGLKNITSAMKDDAVNAHEHGIISLKSLNSKLVEGKVRR